MKEEGRRTTNFDGLVDRIHRRHHGHYFFFRGNHLRYGQLTDVLEGLELDLRGVLGSWRGTGGLCEVVSGNGGGGWFLFGF